MGRKGEGTVLLLYGVGRGGYRSLGIRQLAAYRGAGVKFENRSERAMGSIAFGAAF